MSEIHKRIELFLLRKVETYSMHAYLNGRLKGSVFYDIFMHNV